MLAMYSSLIKKEEIMSRVSQDAEELATIANDLVCELKMLSASSKNKNLENSLENVTRAEELSNEVRAMVNNIKINLNGYIGSLIQREESREVVKEQSEEVKNVKTEEQEVQTQINESAQMSSIFEAIKTLKEMKESLPK